MSTGCVLLVIIVSILADVFGIVGLDVLECVARALVGETATCFLKMVKIVFLLSIAVTVVGKDLGFKVHIRSKATVGRRVLSSCTRLVLYAKDALYGKSVVSCLSLSGRILFFKAATSKTTPLLKLGHIYFTSGCRWVFSCLFGVVHPLSVSEK